MSSNPLVSPSGSPSRGHSRGSSRSSSPSSYSVPRPRYSSLRRPRRITSFVRRLERLICTTAKHFPILLVYSGQTWAVYTEAWSICFANMGGLRGTILGTLGFVLYGMAVWSYTTAVFRDPGSTLTNQSAYTHLPTSEPSTSFPYGPITVKSSGTPRFCKKCQTLKPDRAHHCSTCNRCILKMDHHCPWLATCLGLYNYKPFLLFLIYTSLLCVLSFFVAAGWIWATIFSDGIGAVPRNDIAPVNWILMATVSGIIGLVLSGFTVWHIMLAASGMTTIESLEKVRYSAPGLSPYNVRFTHPENGVDPWSAQDERTREQERYYSYLDGEALGKLPHAFDLGKKQNILDVFGGRMWAWFLPLGMSTEDRARLDGWHWETSRAWAEGAQRVHRQREERMNRMQEPWVVQGPQGGPGGSGAPGGLGGGDRTFETRHYPEISQQSSTGTQRYEPRSAGETPAGMVKPQAPGAGLKAIESRIRNDWAFLDEDPRFAHTEKRQHISPSDDSDSDLFDDSDGEDPAENHAGHQEIFNHLNLRGGKAMNGDIYHREMFGDTSQVGRGRKNVSAIMGGVEPRGRRESKVDRVLGRSTYDSDKFPVQHGELVEMRRLKGHVPLMVAAGRVPLGMGMGMGITTGDLPTLETGKRVLSEAGEVAERVGREVVKAVMGVVDPGMVNPSEARGQDIDGDGDDWSRWEVEGV